MKGKAKNMKIAVTYEDGKVFQHFGHTEKFKIYEIEDGKVVRAEIVSAQGSGHGALAGFLKSFQVDKLICGGIGGGAKNALSGAGIEVFGGAAGNVDEQVKNYLQGSLSYNPNVVCAHHEHHHDGEHSCGNHSCSQHSCGETH